MLFVDRIDAGQRLARRLEHLRADDPVVVALPRGGVPVALEVAKRLGAPLDVIVVRKLGVPFQPELAMGAVGEYGVRVLNQDVIRMAGVTGAELRAVEARERTELERRARVFRQDRPRVPLAGRTVIVVDDGIATGSTARAACTIARAHGARRVILAVPVAPAGSAARFRSDADELICLAFPEPFLAIGQWYGDFSQTTDQEVIRCLRAAGAPAPRDVLSPRGHVPSREEDVEVPIGPVHLHGRLTIPEGASGLVVFAHGSGSSRHSPRNRFVARVLNESGLGTFLFDLLTDQEESDRTNVFDIEMLAGRLLEVTRWLRARPGLQGVRIGYFGASTGAAAALRAAAQPDAGVDAVVSRGGRPDLAGSCLADVTAPTLLIVGGRDEVVLELNRQAQAELGGDSRLEIVPRATHLFEQRGAMEAVAGLARAWLLAHLAPVHQPAA